MINYAAIICLFLILIVNAISIYVVNRLGKLYSIYSVWALGASMLSITANMVIACTTYSGVVMVCESMYYILIAYEFFMFYKLFTSYIYPSNETKTVEYIIRGLLVVDTALLIFNMFTGFVFSVHVVNDKPVRFLDLGIFIENHEPAYFHYVVCFIISLSFMVPSIIRIVTSKGIYKIRYIAIVALFGGLETLLGANFYLDFPVPVVLFLNTLMIMLNYYIMSYYVPEKIKIGTMEESLKRQSSGLVAYDNDGNLALVNEITFELLNIPADDLDALKAKIDELLEKRDGRNKIYDRWIEEIKGKDLGTKYLQIDGGVLRDRRGNKIGGFYSMSDHTAEQNAIISEHYKLTHDELTGLYNKEGFYETVKETLKKEPRSDYMLICTNVRDFKIINDLFGFDKGNEIIQKIAAMINTGTYQKDVTARIVADQFAILTTKDRYDAADMSKQLAEVSKLIASSYYSMTIHCGIYNITNPEMEVSLMCDRANMAISTIRDEPGNTIVTYDDKMMSDILHDRQVANQLEQAIDKNQFVIFLQPQVTSLGEVIGAEALVRWDDPKRGILTPGVFIDILEKTGCLYKLDLHVWELAARQLASWKGTPFERLNISVNISPKDFYYVDVFKEFTGLVNKYDISPSKLKLEITETALMIEPTRQLTLIGKLNNFGFDFEIDDFGTGYSSLSLLKDMPAEILKIDMEFLHETENEQRSKKILESIISLAHELKMKVITEGVEYEHQVKSLRELGCDIFQGYYYSKPLPVSEFEEKYRDHVNK